MLQTIEIYQESSKRKPTSYLAVHGKEQAKGKTPGQALDSLDEMLTEKGKSANSLIILQRFQPDTLFTQQHQERLQELMAQFQQSINHDDSFTPEERAELEQLIDVEWIAAIARASTILTQVNQSPESK